MAARANRKHHTDRSGATSRSGRRRTVLALAFGPVVVAVGLHIYATGAGQGASADAVQYVAAARNLASGDGLTIITRDGGLAPMVIFAPLFPAVLSIPVALGVDAPRAARVGHAVCLALTVWLTACLAFRVSGRSWWTTVFCGLVAATSPAMLSVHADTMSEPMFLVLMLGGFVLLGRYLDAGVGQVVRVNPSVPSDSNPETGPSSVPIGIRAGAPRCAGGMRRTCEHTRLHLAGSAVLLAMACLTRYAGVAIVLAVGIALARRWPGAQRRRWFTATAYTAGCLLPVVAWLVRNRLRVGSTSEHPLAYHPIGLPDIQQAVGTVAGWIVPGGLPGGVCYSIARSWPLIVAVAVLAYPYARHKRRSVVPHARPPAPPPAIVTAAGYVLIVYPVFLGLVRSFVDSAVQFDDRMLLPCLPCGLIVIAWALRRRPAPAHRRAIGGVGLAWPWIAVGIAALLLVGHGRRAAAWSAQAHRDGLYFTARAWRQSPTMARAARLDAKAPLYSNAPDAITINLDRTAAMIPRHTDPITRRPNRDFDVQMATMFERITQQQGAIIYFDRVTWRWYLPTKAELLDRLQSGTVIQLPDGLFIGP